MRTFSLVTALVIGFGCSANAGERPASELLAACDQAAANPFDKTRPDGVPGVSTEKIVPENAINACELAAKAAPNDARIAMQLGRAYEAAKNFDRARIHYFEAYQNGSAQAAANLALLYLSGRGGLPKNEVEAVRLSKVAAGQGNAQGQNGLGYLFQEGRGGLPKDDVEAARLFKLSADQGYPPAQNNLGRFYQAGRGGLPKDDREALRFYRLAADQGNAVGQVNLGFFYQEGRARLSRDEREAVRLYKLSADQGNALGQANLGFAYEHEFGGLPKDEREAVRLFKLSADQGNALGQANLGFAYLRGLGGLPKDEREAARLYKLAADQGNAAAQIALARLNGSQTAPPPQTAQRTTADGTTGGHEVRVKMVSNGGVFRVPVLINNALTLNFFVDSGASDVSIPADVFLTLMRTGTVKESDFIGTKKYLLADGSTVSSRTFILRSLKVGDRTVTDVRASITKVNGPLLLGQSFLNNFKSWSQDNVKRELVLQ